MKSTKVVLMVIVSMYISQIARSAIHVNDTQEWSVYDLDGTLVIEPTGNLTINSPDSFLMALNSDIQVNGGYIEINSGPYFIDDDGTITVNDGCMKINSLSSFHMWPTSSITIHGGSMEIDVDDFEMWSDSAIVINAGTFFLKTSIDGLNFTYASHVNVGPRIIIGSGVMQLTYLDSNWIDNGFIGLAEGYNELVITPDTGQGYTEISAIPEPATLLLFALGGLVLRRKETKGSDMLCRKALKNLKKRN